MRIMGFWLQLGVSGFRMDAVPFLIEKKGAGVTPRKDYELLHEMRDFLQWRRRDAVLLAEANVPPDESLEYFGELGDRLQLMLNFPVNQRLFYAMATGDIKPLVRALEATYERPQAAQWVNFLRSHDELDLGRLTPAQRQRVFEAFGPTKEMQLYDRGIRRRLAPMLDNDRRRLELAFSLLFTLPGTPMLQYGDEIGIGDDLSLAERECARTPMQWSAETHGGFSTADRPVRPVVSDPIYGYKRVNVEAQRRDPQSLLNWVERKIRMRPRMPGDQLGRLARHRPGRRRAGDALRLRRPHAGDRAQLHRQQPGGADRRATAGSAGASPICSGPTTATPTRTAGTASSSSRTPIAGSAGGVGSQRASGLTARVAVRGLAARRCEASSKNPEPRPNPRTANCGPASTLLLPHQLPARRTAAIGGVCTLK